MGKAIRGEAVLAVGAALVTVVLRGAQSRLRTDPFVDTNRQHPRAAPLRGARFPAHWARGDRLGPRRAQLALRARAVTAPPQQNRLRASPGSSGSVGSRAAVAYGPRRRPQNRRGLIATRACGTTATGNGEANERGDLPGSRKGRAGTQGLGVSVLQANSATWGARIASEGLRETFRGRGTPRIGLRAVRDGALAVPARLAQRDPSGSAPRSWAGRVGPVGPKPLPMLWYAATMRTGSNRERSSAPGDHRQGGRG
jgi:hypothetical protein